jgi:Family of unknown function (DUF5317)
MTLALALFLLVLTVPLAGGRLGRLASVEVRWMGLAVVALLGQVLLLAFVPEGDTAVHRVAHLWTYGLAGACLIANLDLRFLWVVGVGAFLNFLAIAANAGVMPASAPALDAAGLDARSDSFTNSNVVADPQLAFLGDVFAVPAGWPAANVFSVGDVVLLVGLFLVLHALSGSRLLGGGRTELQRSQAPAAGR